MNLSPRNKLIAVAAGCLLAIVVLIALLVAPGIQRLGSVDAEIESAVTRADAAKLLLEQRQQIKQQAAATSSGLVQLSVAVPETPEIPSLIIDLHDTARESGVVLRSITPAQPVTAEGVPYVELPLQVEIIGTWADTIEFLSRMNRLTRQFRLNNVATAVMSPPSATEEIDDGLTYPPYYQVQTQVGATAYMIPAASIAATVPAQPAPVEPAE